MPFEHLSHQIAEQLSHGSPFAPPDLYRAADTMTRYLVDGEAAANVAAAYRDPHLRELYERAHHEAWANPLFWTTYYARQAERTPLRAGHPWLRHIHHGFAELVRQFPMPPLPTGAPPPAWYGTPPTSWRGMPVYGTRPEHRRFDAYHPAFSPGHPAWAHAVPVAHYGAPPYGAPVAAHPYAGPVAAHPYGGPVPTVHPSVAMHPAAYPAPHGAPTVVTHPVYGTTSVAVHPAATTTPPHAYGAPPQTTHVNVAPTATPAPTPAASSATAPTHHGHHHDPAATPATTTSGSPWGHGGRGLGHPAGWREAYRYGSHAPALWDGPFALGADYLAEQEAQVNDVRTIDEGELERPARYRGHHWMREQ